MRYGCVFIVGVGVSIVAFGQWADTDGALLKLANLREPVNSLELHDAIQVLRQSITVGDGEAWRQLRALLEDPSRPVDVRVAILELVMDKADARIGREILCIMGRLVDELRAACGTDDEGRAVVKDRQVRLLHAFLSRLCSGTWAEWIGREPQTLDMIRKVCGDKRFSPFLSDVAQQVLKASPAPREQRRAVAEAIVASRRTDTMCSAALLELLDSASFPHLRELVRRWKDDDDFPYMAAAALAHLGDKEIMPDLEAVRPVLRARSVKFEKYIIRYIAQIEVQNPPGKLLDYIASPQWGPPSPLQREWAVERAVAWGLPKEQIREAILRHVRDAQPIERTLKDGRTVTHQPYHGQLKKTGLDLDVLRPDDLPDVPLPTTLPITP